MKTWITALLVVASLLAQAAPVVMAAPAPQEMAEESATAWLPCHGEAAATSEIQDPAGNRNCEGWCPCAALCGASIATSAVLPGPPAHLSITLTATDGRTLPAHDPDLLRPPNTRFG